MAIWYATPLSHPAAEQHAKKRRLQASLFLVSLPFIAVIGIAGIAAPKALASGAKSFAGVWFSTFDWFTMLLASGAVLLSLGLAFSPVGKMKLGRADDEPEFSTASWLSMLFAAGMGTGILFWGVAEPVTHSLGAPGLEAKTESGAHYALVLTALHWGLHAWAIYAIAGLVLAYFCFRHGRPYLPGEPIRCGFRGRWVEPVATSTDFLAILAIVFGVAGSLTMGSLQIQSGLHDLIGVDANSNWVTACILAALVAAYMTSAATSLDKGIKWLSNINIILCLALGLFLLTTGPSLYLLKTFAISLRDYVAALPRLGFQLGPETEGGSWFHAWTITYFLWWIAWAPFVGVFIARISKGRTIREFVVGVLFVPTIFSLLWFATLGGAGLYAELQGNSGLSQQVAQDLTLALFTLFENFPLTNVLSFAAILLVFVFLVTSVDSATFVLGMLTTKGSMNPPTSKKLAWGITLGILGGALALTRNVDVVKSIAILGAIPFSVLLLLQVIGFLRVLIRDLRAAR